MTKIMEAQTEAFITTPCIPFEAFNNRYEFTYFNTILKRYADPDLNHVLYKHPSESAKDGYTPDKLVVPDKLWNELTELAYPQEEYYDSVVENYFKNQQGKKPIYEDKYDTYTLHIPTRTAAGVAREYVELKWRDTALVLYADPTHNHIEIRDPQDRVRPRAIMSPPAFIMKHLFNNGYPIIFLPSVDMDTAPKRWIKELYIEEEE